MVFKVWNPNGMLKNIRHPITLCYLLLFLSILPYHFFPFSFFFSSYVFHFCPLLLHSQLIHPSWGCPYGLREGKQAVGAEGGLLQEDKSVFLLRLLTLERQIPLVLHGMAWVVLGISQGGEVTSTCNFGIHSHGLSSSTQQDVPAKSSVWKSDGLKPGS